MIVLTKMNKEKILINHIQIQSIECIPESKIVMMNHDSYLVQEPADLIVQKIMEYSAKVMDIHRQLTITDHRNRK